jgi:hypothetical protein
MRNFARLERHITAETRIEYVCPCKFEMTFESVETFEESGSNPVFVTKSPLLIECPRCHYQFPAEVTTTKLGDDNTTSLAHLTIEGRLAENRELDIALLECRECGTAIKPGDKTEGHDHPELGWEYYKCSSCNAGYSLSEIDAEYIGDLE